MIYKNPRDDKNPVNREREPACEPIADLSTGQHEPDIQDESSDKRNNKRPIQPMNINPANKLGNDSKEYNDGDPVEEKSPQISNGLL